MNFIDTNPNIISLTDVLRYVVSLYTDEATAANARPLIRTRNIH